MYIASAIWEKKFVTIVKIILMRSPVNTGVVRHRDEARAATHRCLMC